MDRRTPCSFIREFLKGGRVRARYLDEKWLSETFPEEWRSNKNTVLDKAIMHRCRDLDWWLRPYMPREIQEEHDDMVMANMTNEHIIGGSDKFLENHAGSNARLVIVIDRETGFRMKQPMGITLGHRYYELVIDPEFAMNVDKFHEGIEVTKQSVKRKS